MKLLDRYVLVTFLKNYLIAFMVLIGLYIVLDMVFAFDEFAEIKDRVGPGDVGGSLAVVKQIASYYGYQSFHIFVFLSGIIPVVAAAFTIIRLSRFNEMTATLAAGMPLLRFATPIIITGLLVNVLLIVDQEVILPRIIPQLQRSHDQIDVTDAGFVIHSLRDSDGRLLMSARFVPAGNISPATMMYVSIIEYDDQHRPMSLTAADKATWDDADHEWKLTNGTTIRGLLPDERRTSPQPAIAYRSNITPEEVALYRSNDYVDLISTERINELLERRQHSDQKFAYGVTDLLRVKHTRFTQPLLNLVLLLLAMAALLSRDSSRLKVRAFQCVTVVAIVMAFTFFFQQLAGTPPAGTQWLNTWPALMAWMPLIIFGPVAVWMLDRVKT